MNISIVLCTFNRASSLLETLKSLDAMDVPDSIDWEVLVVDNNSSDCTKNIIVDFANNNRPHFKYRFESKQGKTFALNAGIREAKGDVIVFTDDDIFVEKNWLVAIKQAFEGNPDCKAFGGRVIPVWSDTVPKWVAKEGAFKNTWGAIVEHYCGEAVTGYYQGTVCHPCGANMFFAKEIFHHYGGFNECLNLDVKKTPMLEDVEFCKRLFASNEKVLYIPGAIVYHPVAPERLTKNYLRKHAFKSGRAQYVIQDMQIKEKYVVLDLRKNSRSLLNVPLHYVYTIIDLFKKYLSNVIGSDYKAAQFYENSIFYYVGIVWECFVQRKKIR